MKERKTIQGAWLKEQRKNRNIKLNRKREIKTKRKRKKRDGEKQKRISEIRRGSFKIIRSSATSRLSFQMQTVKKVWISRYTVKKVWISRYTVKKVWIFRYTVKKVWIFNSVLFILLDLLPIVFLVKTSLFLQLEIFVFVKHTFW